MKIIFLSTYTGKAAKYGIKTFVLAEAATGYVYCPHTYTGDEKDAAAANECRSPKTLPYCMSNIIPSTLRLQVMNE